MQTTIRELDMMGRVRRVCVRAERVWSRDLSLIMYATEYYRDFLSFLGMGDFPGMLGIEPDRRLFFLPASPEEIDEWEAALGGVLKLSRN